jgi:hypothetical protein
MEIQKEYRKIILATVNSVITELVDLDLLQILDAEDLMNDYASKMRFVASKFVLEDGKYKYKDK